MEANRKYESAADMLYEQFESVINDAPATSSLLIKISTSKSIVSDAHFLQTDATGYLSSFERAGVLKVKEINVANGELNVEVGLIEPQFTYYFHENLMIWNDKSIEKTLSQLQRQSSIQQNNKYKCGLHYDPEQKTASLLWPEGGIELHQFSNKNTSNRMKLYQLLLQHPNQVFTSSQLRDEHSIDTNGQYLHELLSKSFMRKELKNVFVIESTKQNVGIRGSAEINGGQLIKIIREQLRDRNRDQRRHALNRLIKPSS